MTKKLEELLNLPEVQKPVEKAEMIVPEKTQNEVKNIRRSIDEFDKISAALPQVKGLGDKSDQELDSLAQKAEAAYDDLMDLGMQVETRYGPRLFEVAASMLGHAINAKSAKLDKKLKMIELQLKKQAIDQKTGGDKESDIVEGKGFIVADRNSLLAKLKNMDK